MRLSAVIELLLILLLVAFAAYGRVIEHDRVVQQTIKDANDFEQSNVGISTLSLKQATDNVNRYCTCNENICNCCRDFHIPLVQLQGPGCASLQYLQEDNLAVQLSFGDNILTSTIVNGRNPKPVCVPLPGGFTKFCGRIYSIQRDAKNHFKACLGLELQSSTELEASLRVSCFRFGPDGLKLRPPEPLPVVEAETPEDDDDDDFFGLDSDEDDDNEGDTPLVNSVPNSSDEEDDEDDDDDEDVLGFDALLDIITGDDESSTKKPKLTTATPLVQFTIPILTKPTSVSLLESHEVATVENSVTNHSEEENEYNQSLNADVQEFPVTDTASNGVEEIITDASNKIATYAKPAKTSTNKLTMSEANKKKPSVPSNSINAIENETNKKKPLNKPVKDDDDGDDDILGTDLDDDDDDDDGDNDNDDDDDDDDDDEEILADVGDENDSDEGEEYNQDEEGEKEHENDEDEDEKAEDVDALIDDDDDDDDDDAEDAVISALVYDEKEDGKKNKIKKDHQANNADDDDDDDDDDADYGLGISGLLARNRHSRSGRQSKVMRL
ncbi:uncharacterized protein LOC143341182 [Colletes latitarsis]|uniref:uncharacterized protein LOC143341182 n=1 Tax=Colletes latitarsis TaxID=2605962 RepID=UPI004036B6DD